MSNKIPGLPQGDELSLIDDDDNSLGSPGPAVFGERESQDAYQGPERRKYHRRQTLDRRNEVRFEPGKSERRSGLDRRKTNWNTNATV